MLGHVFDLLIDRIIDRTGQKMSRLSNDEDRVRGAYNGAWAIGKTSGRSEQVLSEQLGHWNVPDRLASKTSRVGRSLREWFAEGIPPRTVKRLLKDLEIQDRS